MLHNQHNSGDYWCLSTALPLSWTLCCCFDCILNNLICVSMLSNSLTLICIVAKSCKGGKKRNYIQKLIASITAMKWLLSSNWEETTLHTQFSSWFVRVKPFFMWAQRNKALAYESVWRHVCVNLDLHRLQACFVFWHRDCWCCLKGTACKINKGILLVLDW